MRQPYPLTYHKAGDTWDRTQRYTLPAGTWTATSTARTADGELVQTFTCALTALSADPDGYTHALNTTATAADTADWPLATLLADVVFTDASATPVKRSASAFQIASCAYLPEVLDDYTNLAVIPGDLLALVRGEDGPPGEGMPSGGTTGQVLAKASNTNYDLAWVDQTGGGGTGATNLAYTASPTGGTVTSDTGTDATLPLADGTNAGLMTPAEKAKIAATSGTNTGDQDLSGYSLTSHNHSGTYDPAGTAAAAVSAHAAAADPHPGYALESALGSAAAAATTDFAPAAHVGAGGSAHANAVASGAAGFMSGADKAKLDGIAAGATVAPVTSVAGRTGTVTLTSSDLTDTTAAGRALLDDADAAAQRATLGLGDAATKNVGTAAGTVAAGDHGHSSYETSIADAKIKGVTVLLPVTNDEITLFRARAAMTITKLVAVGGGFTYTVRKAADRSATGTEVVTGGSTVTSTTTGDAVTSFNSASIAAGDYVWLKLTSVTGTPASFNLTMEYT